MHIIANKLVVIGMKRLSKSLTLERGSSKIDESTQLFSNADSTQDVQIVKVQTA